MSNLFRCKRLDNIISYCIFLNIIPNFSCLFLLSLLNELLLLLYLCLNSVDFSPTYDSVLSYILTSALQMTPISFKGVIGRFSTVTFLSICLAGFRLAMFPFLFPWMIVFRFGYNYVIFIILFKLHILKSQWSFGEQLSISCKKFWPMFFFVVLSQGGLYHVIFLWLFRLGLCFVGSYLRSKRKRLPSNAFWHC